MFSAPKSLLQRRKEKKEGFFLSVANSAHRKNTSTDFFLLSKVICMKYCNLLKVETSETGQVEEQN